MSGVGSSELIILLLIGLIVLGPKRLPQIANQLGSWIGQARRMTRAMKRQLEEELDLDENFRPKAPRIAPRRRSRGRFCRLASSVDFLPGRRHDGAELG